MNDFVIPDWVWRQNINFDHLLIFLILILCVSIDYICMSQMVATKVISKKVFSHQKHAVAKIAVLILLLTMATVLDYVLRVGSVCYATLSAATILTSVRTILADIYILGWDRYFPIWLFKFLERTIDEKLKKYKE
jgi:phage-related holin